MKLLIILLSLISTLSAQRLRESDNKNDKDRCDELAAMNDKKKPKLVGINDKDRYEKAAKKFVGLNPKLGTGSGFVIGDVTNDKWPTENPDSGGPRVNLCTCDCVAGDDGVGCVGWGGVAFRYSSLLWQDPLTKAWTGQIQAYQLTSNPTDELNFIGTDTRVSPGGAAIYNVACTDSMCQSRFSGVFRQANGPVSCCEGLADEASNATNSCSVRCGNAPTYTAWLDYCKAEKEDKSLGFSGFGI